VAAKLVYRPAIWVAVRRFHGMGAVDSRSLRCDSYVRMHLIVRRATYAPFRCFGGGVQRDFMQRLFPALHGIFLGFLSPCRFA
jgi:hypothetical protein